MEAGLRSLFDQAEHLEHRQVHRDHDDADHEPNQDHHQRLDDRRQRLDRRVDLVLVEVGDLAEHLLELSGLLADLHHLAHHRREDRVVDERLRDRDAFADLRTNVAERLLDHPVPRTLAGDLEGLDDVHTRGDESRERAREPRHRHLEDHGPDLHRDLQLELIPLLTAGVGLLVLAQPEDQRTQDGEDDVVLLAQQIGDVDDVLRQCRKLTSELAEDLHEDRHEEHEQAGEHQGREDEHHRRIEHRSLDAAFDLCGLLDLVRDAIEDLVQDSRGLTRLDHRDEEAVEDLRMAAHRLREEEATLDAGAQLWDKGGEVEVVGLLLEDDERREDVEARLDHRLELTREDLQGLRLDLLEDVLGSLFAGGRQLVQAVREQAADAELLPG